MKKLRKEGIAPLDVIIQVAQAKNCSMRKASKIVEKAIRDGRLPLYSKNPNTGEMEEIPPHLLKNVTIRNFDEPN